MRPPEPEQELQDGAQEPSRRFDKNLTVLDSWIVLRQNFSEPQTLSQDLLAEAGSQMPGWVCAHNMTTILEGFPYFYFA
jgi:hypothetical protein